MSVTDIKSILKAAEKGVDSYLESAKERKLIDDRAFAEAKENTFKNLSAWLTDPDIDKFSPLAKKGILEAIDNKQWKNIVNAFRQSVRFGTGGIRGFMAFDYDSILRLKERGVDTDILRGPNTINDIVVLLTSAGVAKFGKENNYDRVVIGYDSRVRGSQFAEIVAELFLAYGYTVYFFDAPCPYPEITFAVPFRKKGADIGADIGILISASHNDYRYNGYKLSCANGSQFDPEERDKMYHAYIKKMLPKDVKLRSFKDALPDKLIFLGGESPVDDFDYAGKEANIINIHREHRNHVKKFIINPDILSKQKSSRRAVQIAFCAYYGAGRIAVPTLLNDLGFTGIKIIHRMGLYDLNGLFPAFQGTPGKERQPDPGDPRAALIAINAFKKEYKGQFKNIDILIGTDPDADRCGVTVKVPRSQRRCYHNKEHYHMPADDMWTLLLWYRLKYGKNPDPEKMFVALSHTTSDSITFLARKYKVGVIKSWVGFASLSAVTRDVWEHKTAALNNLFEGRDDDKYKFNCHPFAYQCYDMNDRRSFNVAAMEQSNGFSILGGKPPDARSLGVDGHVRDKDGTLAAVLMAEIAAWAKENKTSLIELLDKHIYLDPKIGMFMTFYEPDPLDGEYPGIEGDQKKKEILRRALGYYQLALTGDLSFAGIPVISANIYRTGKYDEIYPPDYDFQFPDEGVRFYFDEERLNHLTIRPSGTGNSLRFHIQLHTFPNARNLLNKKLELQQRGRKIMNHLRRMLRAPR